MKKICRSVLTAAMAAVLCFTSVCPVLAAEEASGAAATQEEAAAMQEEAATTQEEVASTQEDADAAEDENVESYTAEHAADDTEIKSDEKDTVTEEVTAPDVAGVIEISRSRNLEMAPSKYRNIEITK